MAGQKSAKFMSNIFGTCWGKALGWSGQGSIHNWLSVSISRSVILFQLRTTSDMEHLRCYYIIDKSCLYEKEKFCSMIHPIHLLTQPTNKCSSLSNSAYSPFHCAVIRFRKEVAEHWIHFDPSAQNGFLGYKVI